MGIRQEGLELNGVRQVLACTDMNLLGDGVGYVTENAETLL